MEKRVKLNQLVANCVRFLHEGTLGLGGLAARKILTLTHC
jgi:hypothetical protein